MGPTISILLAKPFIDESVNSLHMFITARGKISSLKMSSTSLHYDFYLDQDHVSQAAECLFMLSAWSGLTAESGGSYEMSETELQQIEQNAEFRPFGHIQLDSLCNQQHDHNLLGQLTVDLMRQFGGIADFGGVAIETPTVHVGILFTVQDEDGYVSQMADLQFLQSYLSDANFRLIK